ncbi:hypothetical protein NDU88_012322 [Pleurodeles waltl]|uniref:Uncharacterized protein n=1 Tax=Pleurodeles waltl TaxID=8319 RepID=A0AAV7R1A7_PLEWA|nr:hypothetical protein NDU88_012322 [Pleurodeles waltl]
MTSWWVLTAGTRSGVSAYKFARTYAPRQIYGAASVEERAVFKAAVARELWSVPALPAIQEASISVMDLSDRCKTGALLRQRVNYGEAAPWARTNGDEAMESIPNAALDLTTGDLLPLSWLRRGKEARDGRLVLRVQNASRSLLHPHSYGSVLPHGELQILPEIHREAV